eukprot:GHRR01012879.1.p1 GENE.GHRR01012879.1~~GHRR01012879.1.p1  ORF type:complete len:659 (+),score=268.86 GHRR01012879.1:2037-4013(+)
MAVEYGRRAPGSSLVSGQQAGPKPLEWNIASVPKGQQVPGLRGSTAYPAGEPAYAARTQSTATNQQLSYEWKQQPSTYATKTYSGTSEGIPGFPGMGNVRTSVSQQRSSTLANVPTAGSPSVVLGGEIAGYRSIVTKHAVSPSGYPIVLMQQQPPVPAPLYAAARPMPLSAGTSAYPTATSTAALPAAFTGIVAAADRDVSPSKAAAVAALAALGGRNSNSPAASGNRHSRPAAGRTSSPAALHSTRPNRPAWSDDWAETGSSGGTEALPLQKSGLQDNDGQDQTTQHTLAPAGRRAGQSRGDSGKTVPATVAGWNNDSFIAGDAGMPAGDNRPPSQHISSGLSKLKQLSSARLASRITTPPAADAGGQGSTSRTTRPNALARGFSAGMQGPAAQHQYQAQQCRQPEQLQQNWQVDEQAVSPKAYNPDRYSGGGNNAAASARGGARKWSSGAAASAHNRSENIGSQAQSNADWDAYQPTASEQSNYPAAAAICQTAGEHGSMAADSGPSCQCPDCGRSFSAQAYDKHVRVCIKVFGQKRKVFNAQAARLQGSEAQKFVRSVQHQELAGKAAAAAGRRSSSGGGASQQRRQGGSGKAAGAFSKKQQQFDSMPAVSAAAAKKSKWQQQSEQLRAAMNRGKGAGGGGGLGRVPEPVEQDDR